MHLAACDYMQCPRPLLLFSTLPPCKLFNMQMYDKHTENISFLPAHSTKTIYSMGPKKRTAIIRRHRRGETANRYTYTLHGADGAISGAMPQLWEGMPYRPRRGSEENILLIHGLVGYPVSVSPTTQQSRESSRLCNVVTIILSEMSQAQWDPIG